MQVVRAKVKKKNARRSSKKMPDCRAKFKQKMRDGRAKKSKMSEKKLNKKCAVVEQKNARWRAKARAFFF
jgi:hypothetical protein